MQKTIEEFEGVEVDADEYAYLAPVIETTRALLVQAKKEGEVTVGRPSKRLFGLENSIKSLTFPTPQDPGGGTVTFTAEKLSQTLNALLVQAGSKCLHGRPSSTIVHHVSPYGSYYKCGHSNPAHYWDEDGEKLDERP